MILTISHLGMISMISWNVRGLKDLNKQKEIKLFCNKMSIGLMGFVETKIVVNGITQY